MGDEKPSQSKKSRISKAFAALMNAAKLRPHAQGTSLKPKAAAKKSKKAK